MGDEARREIVPREAGGIAPRTGALARRVGADLGEDRPVVLLIGRPRTEEGEVRGWVERTVHELGGIAIPNHEGARTSIVVDLDPRLAGTRWAGERGLPVLNLRHPGGSLPSPLLHMVAAWYAGADLVQVTYRLTPNATRTLEENLRIGLALPHVAADPLRRWPGRGPPEVLWLEQDPVGVRDLERHLERIGCAPLVVTELRRAVDLVLDAPARWDAVGASAQLGPGLFYAVGEALRSVTPCLIEDHIDAGTLGIRGRGCVRVAYRAVRGLPGHEQHERLRAALGRALRIRLAMERVRAGGAPPASRPPPEP